MTIQSFNSKSSCSPYFNALIQPLSRDTLEEKTRVHADAKIPLLFAIAIRDKNSPQVLYDAFDWMRYHSVRPKYFFEEMGFTKVSICSMSTITSVPDALPSLGEVTAKNPQVSAYLENYILASSCNPSAFPHIEYMLQKHLHPISTKMTYHFAAYLFAHEPSNETAISALLYYIHKANAPNCTGNSCSRVAALACGHNNESLYLKVLGILVSLPHTDALRKRTLEALKAGKGHFPNNPLILSLLGQYHSMADNFHAALDCLIEAIQKEPTLAMPYFLMAKLLFEHVTKEFGNLNTAKSYLKTFLELGLRAELPDETRSQNALMACTLIRTNICFMNEENLLVYSEMILTQLPGFQAAYNLVPEYSEKTCLSELPYEDFQDIV